jgi:hypothetical protein
VPAAIWLGWLLHVTAYFLPSYQGGSGYQCAWVAVGCWFDPSQTLADLRAGEFADASAQLTVGWFNVTNAAALLAPAWIWLPARWRPWWWLGLLGALGAGLAVLFGLGGLTREREWEHLQIGYFVWLASYVWLAVAAWRLKPASLP